MRRWGMGVAVLAGACAVGGCSLLPPQSVSDTTTLDQPVTAIKLDGRSGRVHVRGQAGLSKVTVERTVRYHDGSPNLNTYRVDGGVLALTGECGSNCDVDYDVTGPAGLPVSGEASNGDVELLHVGAVDVATTSGGIELTDVTGTVKARTSNGEITGSGLRGGGAVQATTSNGAVDLTFAEAADVTARTSNGAIKLAVPSASYRVSTTTGNGHRKIGVADEQNGKYRLDLTTDNGPIEVTQV